MEAKKLIALVVLIFIIILLMQVARPAGSLSEWVKQIGIGDLTKWDGIPIISPYGNSTTGVPRSTTYSYQLVDTTNTGAMDPYGKVFYNAKLIKVFGDGRTETVVENFRNRFSNILSQPNQMLTPYYFPPNSDILYFNFKTYYTSGIDNRYHIYRYNVNTDEMKDLFSNRYLTSYVMPSPYNQLMALAVDDDTITTYQRLYLVDLASDSARIIVNLGGDETLAIFPPGSSGIKPPADLVWNSSNSVGYGVYKYANGNSLFKERRQLSI